MHHTHPAEPHHKVLPLHPIPTAPHNSLVVFGGCTSSCCFAPIDALWELRLAPDTLNAGSWRPLTTPDDDNTPGPRFSTATAVDARADAMYMFGGQDSGQAFLAELWRLELEEGEGGQARCVGDCIVMYAEPTASRKTLSSHRHGHNHHHYSWTRLRTPWLHTPPARGAASLSLVGRHLLLYGGFGRDGARNDAWALDLAHYHGSQQSQQQQQQLQLQQQGEGWQPLSIEGPEPEAAAPRRWHHTAVVVGPRTVAIVGGSDEEGRDVGDAWTLEVDFEGQAAAWAPLVVGNDGIPPRHGHAALAASKQASSFVVFGGTNTTADTLPDSFLGDAYRLDVAAAKWTPIGGGDEEEEGAGPGARAYAAVGHGPGHSVVWGGFAGYTGDVDDRLLGDAWVFRHGAQMEKRDGDVVAVERG